LGESLSVRKGSDAETKARKIAESLDDYPVLDESDFCKREMEEASQVWSDCYNPRERVAYIRKHRNQFDFQDFKDLRAVVKGEYFIGYASELIA
jgi:hypothetical protein